MLQVVHAHAIAEEVEEGILEHASVAVAASESVIRTLLEPQIPSTAKEQIEADAEPCNRKQASQCHDAPQ